MALKAWKPWKLQSSEEVEAAEVEGPETQLPLNRLRLRKATLERPLHHSLRAPLLGLVPCKRISRGGGEMRRDAVRTGARGGNIRSQVSVARDFPRASPQSVLRP